MSRTGGRRTIRAFDPATFRGDRLDAGLQVKELARLAGVSRETIRLREAGRCMPWAPAYRRVLDVLLDAEEQSPPGWLWRRHLEAASWTASR